MIYRADYSVRMIMTILIHIKWSLNDNKSCVLNTYDISNLVSEYFEICICIYGLYKLAGTSMPTEPY